MITLLAVVPDTDATQGPPLLNGILAAVPWLLIFGFTWFFVYRYLRKQGREKQETQLLRDQVTNLEKKVDLLTERQNLDQS